MKHLSRLSLALALLAMTAIPASAHHPCDAFRNNGNGSFTVLKPITMQGPNGSVQIGSGMTFGPGVLFMGVDLSAGLQAHCSFTQ
ncbi:hypothetical protein [Methylocystis parvus]|uniref:Uncharacterized protein n=1 Tax=Methylocystis parvus TaxID=134 RepID=A0A6B8LXM6_9HYPH|nr:hypothetical protein [Methylocystis parvus]QGM96204.1 hypothetical protein F7D14_00995 [Methylocystis parvus]WBJ99969.1 hypothetical protein MMG94_18620 [Methylocystis parvus OBBP]